MRSVAALALTLLTGPVEAQGVPDIDIEPSCKAASSEIGIRQDFEYCRRSEMNARALLVKHWASFPPEDRAGCYSLTTTGTPGTYTELLTCLEMRRDARKLPDGTSTRRLGE